MTWWLWLLLLVAGCASSSRVERLDEEWWIRTSCLQHEGIYCGPGRGCAFRERKCP